MLAAVVVITMAAIFRISRGTSIGNLVTSFELNAINGGETAGFVLDLFETHFLGPSTSNKYLSVF